MSKQQSTPSDYERYRTPSGDGKVYPGSWDGRRNRIRCLKCLDVIEATHGHDFKSCKCGFVSIDGGALGHWRRLWKEGDPKQAWEEIP